MGDFWRGLVGATASESERSGSVAPAGTGELARADADRLRRPWLLGCGAPKTPHSRHIQLAVLLRLLRGHTPREEDGRVHLTWNST